MMLHAVRYLAMTMDGCSICHSHKTQGMQADQVGMLCCAFWDIKCSMSTVHCALEMRR